ncbi:MAG: periplasmic protein-like protein [Betaproteobacteria bacterium]|nr:periplasmic protein-like protein [Betaproteobacteria bacterium]
MNAGRIVVILFALASGCCTGTALGATRDESLAMDFVEPDSRVSARRANDERWTIFLDGRIDEAAAERFRDEIARRQIRLASVFFNSQGGALWEGIELGRVIRQHGFSTHIGKQDDRASTASPGMCYSACVFAFIGGKYRFYAPPSKIGVHRFSAGSSADTDADQVQIASAAIVNFIREMQIDVGLFDRMSRVGKDQILVLPQPELEKLRVVNHGRLTPEWSFDSLAGITYLKAAQQTWLGTGEIVLSCRERQAIFQVRFDAGDNADAVQDPGSEHSIGFGNGYLPLGEPLARVTLHDNLVTAEFALSAGQIQRLANAVNVGYSARLANSPARAGFTIDTAGPSSEKISSFLNSCEH